MDAPARTAFERVERVFSARPKPLSVPHCGMCCTTQEVTELLRIPYPMLTVAALQPILWNAFMCWGTWPEVAFYVSRLLEFYAEEALPDDDDLYTILLLAARPELGLSIGEPTVGETMTPKERASVFAYIAAVLESRLGQEAVEDRTWKMHEAISFLAAFDQPLGPVLRRLEASRNSRVRANVCLFLTDRVWSPAGTFDLPPLGSRLKTMTPLPENEAALAGFFGASHVADYLGRHLEDTAIFGSARQAEAEMALEWALSEVSSPLSSDFEEALP